MIRIPRQCKALGGAMQKLVDTFQKCCVDVSGGRAVEYERIEKNLAEASAGIERAAHGDILANMAVTHPRIEVSGKVYARAARGVGTYFTLAGPIEIERYLYRELGRRGGPTIDPIALRIGAVGDGWLPQTAAAMAHYVQALTSREAV